MRLRRKLCAAAVGALAALVPARARAATVPVAAPGRDAAEAADGFVFPLDDDFDPPAADRTPDGGLYFRLRAQDFGNDELRGQLQSIGDAPTDAGNGTAIPLPPVLPVGLVGLVTAGWAARRHRQ
jgi:hypothetical protein